MNVRFFLFTSIKPSLRHCIIDSVGIPKILNVVEGEIGEIIKFKMDTNINYGTSIERSNKNMAEIARVGGHPKLRLKPSDVLTCM